MSNSWIRDELRFATMLRDGLACYNCGDTAENGAQLGLDHIIPRSKGGSNRPGNLITCCHSCNSKRSNKPLSEFVTDPDILAHIARCRRRSIRKYRAMAKEIMADRNTARQVLDDLSEKDFKCLLARAGSHHAR